MRTGFRDHGFHGHAFVGSRLLSLIALFAIIGLVATFMIEINHAELTAPQQLTSTIIISGCALLWVFLSFTAYDDTHIPYISTAIIDAVFLIPFSVAAVVLGRPVSQKDCSTLLKESGNETTTTLTLLSTNTSGNGTASQLSFDTLLGTDQITCFKLKATWGLMVALCILFVFSAVAISFIFLRKRRNGYGGRGATKRDWAWWNIWRLGEGRQKRGHQPTKTWTNVNVNNTRGASGLASNSSNNSESTRNINKHSQALESSSSKNNNPQSSSHSSSSAPGRWNFGFGRLWRKGGGGVDQSAKNRNLQGGYALTDSSKRYNKNDKDVPNANFNPGSSSRVMDFGDQQRKKSSGFFSLFRSKDKDKSNTTPALPNGQRPPEQPYAQEQAADSSRSRIVDNQKGPAPRDGTVNGRTGRPGPGIAGEGRDPNNSSSSKGTIPKALDSTKYGDKNIPPQRKKVTSPLTKNPVTSSAAPGGRVAELSKGPAVSDANNRIMPGSTKSDRNGPNSGLDMKGKTINTISGARSSPGAINGNHAQGGERNLGVQRPGLAHRGQSPARIVAAAYRPQGDVRRPGEPPSSARDAIKLVWNGAGSKNFEKPAHGQPLPHNDNGRHKKTVQEKVVTKNDFSARLGDGLFSREKNSSSSNIMTEPKGRGTEQSRPHNNNNNNNPGKEQRAPYIAQMHDSLGLKQDKAADKGKKPAAPSANSQNPQVNRNLSAAEASSLSMPLNPTVQEATGRGKTHAEKKGELENKPRVGDLPLSKPHMLEPQQRPFNAGAGAGGGVPLQNNGHTQMPNLLQPGPGRTAGAGCTKSPGRNDKGRPVLREKTPGHEVHKNEAPATQNGKSGRLLVAHHLPGHHGPDAKSDTPGDATLGYHDKGKNVPLQTQGPRNPQDMAPAQIGASSLPMRDAKVVHPAPPKPGQRDLAGGGRPKFEQRERPVIIQVPPSSREQRDVPDGVASDRKRGGAEHYQRSAEAEVARTLSPGRNPREISRDGRNQTILPARDGFGREIPRQKPADSEIPSALAPGRNTREISRDGRGQPTSSPRALNERVVPVALASGIQGLQQPAKVPKDANGRHQPSPPREWSLRPPSPQNSQGPGRSLAIPNIDQRPSSPPSSREQRPEGPISKKREQLPNSDRQPSPSKARPVSPSTKGGHSRQQYKREDIALGDGHPQDKNGPSLPPSAAISGLSTERSRGMPQRGGNVATELLQLPPSIEDTPMTRSSSPSRPRQILEDRQAFVSRDGLPLHDERGLPARLGASREPVAPSPFLRNPAQGQEPSPSPGMPARMPEHTNGQQIQPHNARIYDPRDPNFNDLADVSRGNRMPRPANKPLTLDPRAPPTRDGQKYVRDEHNTLNKSNASLGPRQAQPTTDGIPTPPNASVDDPQGRPSTSRGPQQMDRPMLDRQNPLPSEMKAEGSRGRAPPLSSQDSHIRGHQRPDATKKYQWPAPSVMRVDDASRRSSSPISHELNDDKGQAAFRTALTTHKTKLATLDNDAPGAAESSQKPSIWTSWISGSKKNKKSAQTSTPAAMSANTAIQRPSLLPPGRGPKSLLPTATEAPGQYEQRGHAHSPSLPQENTGVPKEGRLLIRQPMPSSPDGLRRPSSSSSSIEQINHLDMPVATSDGQQRLPGFATAQEPRGRFPPFPTRTGQKDESSMPQAVASARNQNLERAEGLDIQPFSEVRDLKKANRKSRVTLGMVPIIAAGEEPFPLPPFPTSPTTRDGSMRLAAVDMPHMPPMPVLDDNRQRRVSNRKSRVLPGSFPLDFQMPPMPPMPEQAPIVVRRDSPMDYGLTECKPLSQSSTKTSENGELFRGNGQRNSPMPQSSSVPLPLRPGGPQWEQGDVAAQLAGQQPVKQKEGFPPRTTSRGLGAKPLSPAANGITMPQAPSSEAQESLRYDPMVDDLKPGRPNLKLQIENSTDDPITAVSDVLHIPPPISAITGSEESHKPSGLESGKDQLGKEKEERHPLSLRDGNSSQQYTIAADKDLLVFKATGLPVPSSQMPGSTRTNKLQGISGNGDVKGKYPDAESPLQDDVPSTPPPRYSWVETGSNKRRNDVFSDPTLQDGQVSMPEASRHVKEVDVGQDGLSGFTELSSQVEENKGMSKAETLSSLSNASGHNKESDTTPRAKLEAAKKTGFLGSLFGGKDTLSPIGPPITKDAAPWSMEQDQNVSEKKVGMAWSGGDKKDEKQRRGSRDSLTNSPTNKTGSIKPWLTSGDQLGETSHHEEKAGFLGFGNTEPIQEPRSPGKGDEELFDYGVGDDKNQQPRSPGASPTSSTGGDDFFLERFSTKTDFVYKEDFDEQKPGSLSNDKSQGGSPAGSPALQSLSSSSPRLDLWSTRENMGVQSSNDGFGSINNFGKIENQRRGSSSQPLSPAQESLRLKPANGDVERSALDENKRGLSGLFGTDKEKQKRRGSQPQPMSPNKHASPDESLKSMETQQPDLDQPVAMPDVLDLQEHQHPGSRDEESGLFFGKSGNKDIAQPLPEDSNHLDTDAPISPTEDYNDIMDMYQTTAVEPESESESPMLQDFSESPCRYLDDDRLDSAEPEKPKPAPLNLKEKWKNLFNKSGSSTASKDNDASEKDSHPEFLDDFESSGMDDHGASGMGIGPSQYDLGGNPAQNNPSPPAADVGMPMEPNMPVESDLPMGSPTQPVSSDFELPDTDTPEPPFLGSTVCSEDGSEHGPAPHHQADETPETSLGADEGNINNEPIPLEPGASEPSFGLDSDDMVTSVPPPKDLPNEPSGMPTPMNENPVAESVSETGEFGSPDVVAMEQAPGPISSPALMSDNIGDSSFEPVADHDAPHADDCLIDTDASNDMPMETSTELPSPVNEAPSVDGLQVEPPADILSPQVDEMDMDGMHIPSQVPNDDFSPPSDGSGDDSQVAEEPLVDDQPTTSGFCRDSFEPAPESQDPVVESRFEPVLIGQAPIEPLVGGDDSPMDTDDSRDIPMETGMGLPADSGEFSPPEEEYIEPSCSEPAPDVVNNQEDVMDDEGEPGLEDPPMDDVVPTAMDDPPPYDGMPPMDDDVPMGDELPLNEALPVDDQMPIDDDPPPTDDVYEEVQILDGEMDRDIDLENEGFPVASPEEPLQGDLIGGWPEESPEYMPAELGEGDRELGEDFTEEPPQAFTEEFPQDFAEEQPHDNLGEIPGELPREDLLEGSPECIDEGNVGEDEQAELGEEGFGEGDCELGYELDSQEPEPEAFDCDEEQPQAEDDYLDRMEGDEERGHDDELTGRDVEEDEEIGEEQLEDEVDGGSMYEIGEELDEKESGDEPDEQDEQDEEDGGLDDEELEAIRSDDILDSPTEPDYGRGIASSGTEEHPAETSDDPAQEEQTTEPENPCTVRLSQIYRQSAVFSPLPSATPPPSPPPGGEEGNVQPDGELEYTDPIRYSHLYRQSIDLDMAFSMDSPTSDAGLSAIAESPNIGPVQTFDVPILAPVPDFAKRRSQRMSARMSTMSQPLSPIAASPLSPLPPPSPPLESDEDYDQQHHYDSSDYDLERGLSPVEDIYQNYYDEDDEHEPQDEGHLDHDSGLRGGPQTFDDMKLSPRPGSGLSVSSRYSHHEDLEQGPPPVTPNGSNSNSNSNNRKTLLGRMSGWWSTAAIANGGGSVSAQGLGIISPPPPPLPYDSGRYVAEPGSPSSFV